MINRIAGGVLIAFALVYGLGASRLRSGFGSGPIEPKSFPLMLAIALGVTGLLVLFLRDRPAEGWPNLRGWGGIGLLLASFIAYAYLLIPIGFIAATTLETGLVSQRFGAKLWQALVTGLTVSLLLYALFVFALGIPLPVGRIFGGR